MCNGTRQFKLLAERCIILLPLKTHNLQIFRHRQVSLPNQARGMSVGGRRTALLPTIQCRGFMTGTVWWSPWSEVQISAMLALKTMRARQSGMSTRRTYVGFQNLNVHCTIYFFHFSSLFFTFCFTFGTCNAEREFSSKSWWRHLRVSETALEDSFSFYVKST